MQELAPPAPRPRRALSSLASAASGGVQLVVRSATRPSAENGDGWMLLPAENEGRVGEEGKEASEDQEASAVKLKEHATADCAAEKGEAPPPAQQQQASFGTMHGVAVSEATFRKGNAARQQCVRTRVHLQNAQPTPQPRTAGLLRCCVTCMCPLPAPAPCMHAAHNPGIAHHVLLYHVFFVFAIAVNLPLIIVTARGNGRSSCSSWTQLPHLCASHRARPAPAACFCMRLLLLVQTTASSRKETTGPLASLC